MKQLILNYPECIHEIVIQAQVPGAPWPTRLKIVPREVQTPRCVVDINESGIISVSPIDAADFLDAMREIQKQYKKDNDGQIAHERAHALMCEILKQKGFHEGLEILDKIKPY